MTPLNIFHFPRAYRASVAYCVIVFKYRNYCKTGSIVYRSSSTKRENQVRSLSSQNITPSNPIESHGHPEHNTSCREQQGGGPDAATRDEYGRLNDSQLWRHDRWCTYGFLTSQSPCDGYTPDGLKNGDLSPIGYHRQTALNLRFQVGENCRKFHAPEQNPTENYGT